MRFARFAAILVLAAAAACDSFGLTEAELEARLTAAHDGVDGADSVGDSTDVWKLDSDGAPDTDVPDTQIADSSSDSTGEEVAETHEVEGSDVAGEEVVADDGKDVEVIADADALADSGDDVPDIEELDTVDADSSDDADSSEDVPDVIVDADGDDVPTTDGGDDTDVVVQPEDVPDVVTTDLADAVDSTDTADSTDSTDSTDVADVVEPEDTTDPEDVPADNGEDIPVADEDTNVSDGSDGDIVEPPDTTPEEDIPVVDKCLGVLCDESDPCAPEACNTATGECEVELVELVDDVACEDGDFCTVGDVCGAGVCHSGVVDPEVCQCAVTADCAHLEDATMCTKPVTCDANVCVLGALVNCEDGNPCSYDLCVAESGLCSFPEVLACCRQNEECDDSNACTKDWCELKPGIDQNMCFYENLDVTCEDGDACTVGDRCSLATGECISGEVEPCSDGDSCTEYDTCVNGECLGKTLDCSDTNPCTQNEGCVNGQCITPTSTQCADADACTYDDCNLATGCTHIAYSSVNDSESAGKAGDGANFQAWFIPDAGWGVGKWCAAGNPCDKVIGIKLSDTSKVRVQMPVDYAENDYGGITAQPLVLEFSVQHRFDIVGTQYPSVEVWQNSEKLAEHTFMGPSESHAFLVDIDPIGDIEIRFKRNGAKVSTSPVFGWDIYFVGEIIVRDACP